jgi:hypothetical protein
VHSILKGHETFVTTSFEQLPDIEPIKPFNETLIEETNALLSKKAAQKFQSHFRIPKKKPETKLQRDARYPAWLKPKTNDETYHKVINA